VKLGVDLGVVNVLDRIFLGLDVVGVISVYLGDYVLVCVRLAILVTEFNGNVALHIHEGGDLVKAVRLIGLLGVSLLCRLVVGFKLLFEELKGLLVILNEDKMCKGLGIIFKGVPNLIKNLGKLKQI
jgi:hypothetical protein